jgi:hypothetical protein
MQLEAFLCMQHAVQHAVQPLFITFRIWPPSLSAMVSHSFPLLAILMRTNTLSYLSEILGVFGMASELKLS